MKSNYALTWISNKLEKQNLCQYIKAYMPCKKLKLVLLSAFLILSADGAISIYEIPLPKFT